MGRTRGCLWLLAGLVVALLAGVVGFMTLSRATSERAGAQDVSPQVQVVVASQAVVVRSALKTTDVSIKNMPVDAVPEGALRDLAEVVGKVTLVDLYTGEIILRQRLADPNVKSGDGRIALALADDQVLVAYPAVDLMSRSGVLKPGDRVDLFFSAKFDSNRTLAGAGVKSTASSGSGGQQETATFDALQSITISAVVAGPGGSEKTAGPPTMLLLTLSPQDALTLKFLKDADGILDIVLRAPGVERPFVTDPVDADYLIRRYRIPVEVGR